MAPALGLALAAAVVDALVPLLAAGEVEAERVGADEGDGTKASMMVEMGFDVKELFATSRCSVELLML